MNNSLTIIGAGAWGSALAIALSHKFDKIFLLAKDKASSDALGKKHSALSKPYNQNIFIDSSYEVINHSKAVLIATPSSAFGSVLKNIKDNLNDIPIAWVTKGFDPETANLLHETFNHYLTGHHPCVISGPTFAAEIVEEKPAAIVVASKDKKTRDFWSDNLVVFLRILKIT